MNSSRNKPIRFSRRASGYLDRRGFTEVEVEEAIRSSAWLPARNDRLEAAANFRFDGDWNGRFYSKKRVRAIFVEEAEEIVVATVYPYFS